MGEPAGGHKRSLASGMESPAKRTGTEGQVDMGILRQLLADQAAMILESQRQHLDQVLAKRDEEVNGRFGQVEERLDSQGQAIAELKSMVGNLSKGGSSYAGDGSTVALHSESRSRYRYTLVWGRGRLGARSPWAMYGRCWRDSRLQVSLMRTPGPWTGSRRSVALANFAAR